MNEKFKRLTDEVKASFSTKLADKAFSDMLLKVKEAGADTGTFKVIVSTQDKDRQGDIVMQNGWDLSFYKLNPVVLWAHDYSELPIGMCTLIEVQGNQLVAEGKFAPHEFAQDVRKLYDLGMMSTTSVGFIPRQFDANDSYVITAAELLEFSFVPVPANPYALSVRQMKELGLEARVEALTTKGMKFEIKEETPPAAAPAAETPVTPAAETAPVAPATEPVVPVAAGGEAAKATEPSANEVRLSQTIKTVYEHLSAACTALKECVDSEGAKTGAGNSTSTTVDKKTETKNADLADFEKFMSDRELLRTFNKAIGMVLRKFNKQDRTSN